MKDLIRAIRAIFKKKKNNWVKVLSLGIGLAMGLVLFAKVFYEYSYDDFYPDKERIYKILSTYTMEGEEDEPHRYISGGVASGMGNEIPEVEKATRFSYMGNQAFSVNGENKYRASFILGDTCLFDVLPRPVILGDVKEILSRPRYVMISRKMAEILGGIDDITGKSLILDMAPDKPLIVGGVFEDIPENSHIHYDIIVSLNSISQLMWDGSQNWDGNAVYEGYVKLYPGVDPLSLSHSIREMQNRHTPIAKMKENGIDIQYTLCPLTEFYINNTGAKRQSVLLGLLGLVVLVTAIMNYILIVLSSLITRTKEIAVYKSYGASGMNIMMKIFTETLIHLFFSILLAIFVILLFQGKIVQLLGVSVFSLFTFKSLVYLTFICLFVFLLAGLVPGFLFARVPVAAAFRNFKESRKVWKKASLFFQFTATTILVTLLVVIWKQYNFMINTDPGYEYENLLYCDISSLSKEEQQTLKSEIGRLAIVRLTSTCSDIPLYSPGGNNVYLPESDVELFNCADIDGVDENYLRILGIPLLKGVEFIAESTPENACLVNEAFEEKISQVLGWDDGIIGKELRFTQHGKAQIRGVVRSFRLGNSVNMDSRPIIIFYKDIPEFSSNLLIRLHTMNPDNIKHISDQVKQIIPNKELNVQSYALNMFNSYHYYRLFRESVMLGGVIALILSFIGLIGYLKDEISRRKSEIAIRKINGSSIAEILRLFMTEIIRLTIPSIIVGGLIAYFLSVKWLEDFAEKTNLSLFLFIGCAVVILLAVLSIIFVGLYRTAKENPIYTMRSE